jgi:hypothetical protein
VEIQASVTTGSPDEQGTPIPPEDSLQPPARRVWRDVRALLIASCVTGGGVIAILLMLGWQLAGVAGVTFAARQKRPTCARQK